MAAIGGLLVAFRYHYLGLTLSHYDARGHLVVARRILDSVTPGWQQIGAVWLPLPHLLNALPVQVDAWYRSGASAVAISIVAFAIAVAAIARVIHTITGSTPAAVAGAAVFALNPNVLYLQATPMTEPLLLALTTLAVALLLEWCDSAGESGQSLQASAASDPSERWQVLGVGLTAFTRGRESTLEAERQRQFGRRVGAGPHANKKMIGVLFALACWTRYEAWPVTASALAAAVWVRGRRGEPLAVAGRHVASIAAYPALAIVSFAVLSRVVGGEWLTTSGFFVPENEALGDPVLAAAQVWSGARGLSGPLLMALALLGMGTLVAKALSDRQRAGMIVVLSLVTTAAVPWVAFLDGHPFRIRYMIPLIAIQAVAAGAATILLRRWRLAGAIILLGVVSYELRPLDLQAPMVVEAQWDRPNLALRDGVTACLGTPQPGAKIMASMGSLAHYMQQASQAGFRLSHFLHEGNGDIWIAAFTGSPRPFADWVLIEEKAEGGDMLAIRARQDAHFLDGYSRVCEGAGLALYRRD